MEEPATAVLVPRNQSSPLQRTRRLLKKKGERDDDGVNIASVASRKRTAASAILASMQVK